MIQVSDEEEEEEEEEDQEPEPENSEEEAPKQKKKVVKAEKSKRKVIPELIFDFNYSVNFSFLVANFFRQRKAKMRLKHLPTAILRRSQRYVRIK